ncbi:MAG: cbb3-type cytochrome c oxidase subunit 3 [Magnetococcales bacterium]|nr:cbb3-type cytochrome c oxidase subunit 3 [Magnetococcales bacterium]
MDFDTLVSYSRQFGLVWFFLLFVGIVAWAYWPGNKKRFEKEGQKILEDGDDES